MYHRTLDSSAYKHFLYCVMSDVRLLNQVQANRYCMHFMYFLSTSTHNQHLINTPYAPSLLTPVPPRIHQNTQILMWPHSRTGDGWVYVCFSGGRTSFSFSNVKTGHISHLMSSNSVTQDLLSQINHRNPLPSEGLNISVITLLYYSDEQSLKTPLRSLPTSSEFKSLVLTATESVLPLALLSCSSPYSRNSYCEHRQQSSKYHISLSPQPPNLRGGVGG